VACSDIQFGSDAAKYFRGLDRTTQKRIKDKITELAKEPFDIRTSKPLRDSTKRSARVGGYRILFVVKENILLVSDIGPRGQIYRKG
jgi:mRNA-degrading endonuclease RelE of RelBE toxin-antitoxin system